MMSHVSTHLTTFRGGSVRLRSLRLRLGSCRVSLVEGNVSCEVKIALIGNKCEMEAKRVVTREMGEEF
ncbi:hypothetical protein GBAR_LOCUS24229, partial [Geodia barretti]